MKEIRVLDVLRECGGTLFCGNESLVLEHFSKDTRTLKENDVYIGIKGENFDGNAFYLEALKQGASCCILDYFDKNSWDDSYSDRTIILVSDSVKALQDIARYKRSLISIPVIAVTGSAGKTSTKDMIAEILKQKYKVYKTPGNLNGQIGLPLNILELKDEEVMVLEMGMNDFGQIARLSSIAKPTMAVITNIGTAHIGLLGSRENILKAKLEILEGMLPNSPVIINEDNDFLSSLHLPNYDLKRCSLEKSCDYFISNIQIEEEMSHFDIHYKNENYSLTIPVMGNAFIMDSLLSICVSDILGLNMDDIQKGLKNFHLTGNRMEVIKIPNNITILNDTYNSNYEAIVSALSILRCYSGRRRIAVLGDVLELEDFAQEIHHKIGLIPDLKEVDALFLNGENAKYIKDGALEQKIAQQKIFYYENKEDLENNLQSFLHSYDVVLVKASHGMMFHSIVEKLKES